MSWHCKGCGEPMENIDHAISRYGHGEICSSCGVLEAFSGDFIEKYTGGSFMSFPAWPADYLKA